MHKRATSSLVGLATLSLAIAATGCSSDRSLAPSGTVLIDAQVSADIAANGGNAAVADLQDRDQYLLQMGMLPNHVGGAPVAHGDGSPPPNDASAAPKCDYSEASGHWSCAPFTNARGLTVTRSYAFFNAAGGHMQRFSESATAKVSYQTEKHGPVGDGGKFSGVTHRTNNETTSGLLGAETTRVWDGAGVSADTVTYRDSTTARHYAGVRLDSLKGVTFVHPRVAGTYPRSGQTVQVSNYTVTSTGKSTETRSVSRRVVTTYNGTEQASMQSGKLTCTLHLDTGKVDGCHS
ncbi:MAG: hypothetical protein ACR2M1_07830 [Gemmatimonadaceae bacterium]